MTTDYQKEIREICTYYSELGEGTAGYSLSEEQFQKLFALLQQSNKEAEKRIYIKALDVLNDVMEEANFNSATKSMFKNQLDKQIKEEVHTDPDLEGRI